MSRWWRAYDEAVDDPKLGALSDRQHRAWFNLCCICSQNGGSLPGVGAIAFKLRITSERAKQMIAELAALGLIDLHEGRPPTMHNWSGRQFQSDISTERVKRFRAKPRNVSETPPENRDREQKGSEASASAAGAADGFGDTPGFLQRTADDAEPLNEDSRAKLFRLGKTILVSFGVAERRTGGLIGQWLKAQNDPDGLLAALQFARDRNVAEPVAYVSALIHGKPNGAANGFDRRPGESLGQLCTRLASEARKLEAAAGFG